MDGRVQYPKIRVEEYKPKPFPEPVKFSSLSCYVRFFFNLFIKKCLFYCLVTEKTEEKGKESMGFIAFALLFGF